MSYNINSKYSYLPHQNIMLFTNEDAKFKIISKGRRIGLTFGLFMYAADELRAGRGPILWGDTIQSNIDRYMDRYMKPILQETEQIFPWKWNSQKKILTVGDQFMDFRSADRPENWEGFSYKKILLNEAGIILKDPYLYDHAVLPMLLDYPESQLIAGGVPKGKKAKEGDHKFYELMKRAQAGEPGFAWYRFPTECNLQKYGGILTEETYKILTGKATSQIRQQEFEGRFIDLAFDRFFHSFDNTTVQDKVLVDNCMIDRRLPIYLSFDFNKAPVTCLATQRPKSKLYEGNAIRHIKEFRFDRITVKTLASKINSFFNSPLFVNKYGRAHFFITGDAAGRWSDDPLHGNFVTYYQTIQKELSVSDRYFMVPKVNPSIIASREQCCSIFENHPDVQVSKAGCPYLVDDLLYLQSNAKGTIDKSKDSRISHLADCLRYDYSTFEEKWLDITSNAA